MNDREKMLAHLQLALKTRDHMTAVRFVMDHGEKLTALLTEPTLEEVLAELESQEFFHDGLAGDLHDVPDKAHAYRLDGGVIVPRELIEAILTNDPDDMAADGVTLLDVWRRELLAALEAK